MSVKYLLDEIEKNLQEVFKGYKLVNQREKLASLNIYQYNLPEKQEEYDEEHFPYIIIRPTEGSLNQDEETVTTTLIFGISDDRENKQGAADITNMIEKYKNHLANKKFVGTYEVLFPITWELQDEDTHPLYFGGIAVMWKLHNMKQKEAVLI